MANYALISCTKSKRGRRCLAREMYDASPLFRKAYAYCTRRGLTVLILSAKYGLITPETEIDPYDETLNTQTSQRLREWAGHVSVAVHQIVPAGSPIELHAGRNYTKYLDLSGYSVTNPAGGLQIGRRLQWYSKRL